jgi:hypothetical protein
MTYFVLCIREGPLNYKGLNTSKLSDTISNFHTAAIFVTVDLQTARQTYIQGNYFIQNIWSATSYYPYLLSAKWAKLTRYSNWQEVTTDIFIYNNDPIYRARNYIYDL